jgi:hypothetical protein
MPAYLLETSVLKLVPALILSIIPCWVVLKVLGKRLFGSRHLGMAYPGFRPAGRAGV